jgi:hypothetical protein
LGWGSTIGALIVQPYLFRITIYEEEIKEKTLEGGEV